MRVRYADNKADSDITVLMLAPWPETLWAFVASGTASRQSGGRSPSTCRIRPLRRSPRTDCPRRLGSVPGRSDRRMALGAPHVVGPDVGTAAALFLAARSPERVTSLTIGGGGPLPDQAGRAQGHHRSAESGRRARAGRENQHRLRRGRRRERASLKSTRTTSAPTISDASRSRPGLCGITRAEPGLA